MGEYLLLQSKGGNKYTSRASKIFTTYVYISDKFYVTWRSDWKSTPKQPYLQCSDLPSLETSKLRQEQTQQFVVMAK